MQYRLLHQIFVNVYNIAGISSIIIDRKIMHQAIKSSFFKLPTVIFPLIFLKCFPSTIDMDLFYSILLRIDKCLCY